MVTTFRLAALAVAAGAFLAPAATAAPGTVTIGLENGCEPITGACTIVKGDWGVKVVRNDPNCPSPDPNGVSTGIYVGHGSWSWVACMY